MRVENDFDIEDIVYLKHDIEQKPRMILSIIIDKYCIMYEIVSGTEYSKHYSFELSKDKNLNL
jgi:hypothetical protein